MAKTRKTQETKISSAVRYACGLNIDKGSHGRAWAAVPGREARQFRNGSKRAIAAPLALRECGASDIEIASIFLGRAPEHERERQRAHVEFCDNALSIAGYAGAWVRIRVSDYLAAVEVSAGRDAARRAAAALRALPAEGTVWILFLFPEITETEKLAAAVEARLEYIAAASAKRAAPKRKRTAAKRRK